MSSLYAHKKRHRKKRHHVRSHEEVEDQETRPMTRENIGVDIEEVKTDQADAEKATMDMIKEELSKEMGGDADDGE